MLLGCTGGQQTAPTSPQGQPEVPPNAQGGYVGGPTSPDTASVENSQTPAEPAGQGTTPAEASGSGFDAFAAKISAAEYKATYSVVFSGQTSTRTQVMKGTKVRFDSTSQGQTSSVYVIDRMAYICMSLEGSPICYSTTMPDDDLSTTVAKETAKYTITPLPLRTVAGLVGSCWSFSGDEIEGTMESCYSAEGVLLYSSVIVQGQAMVTEATSVQIGNVADSEFTLPAEPTALPTYGDYGGYG